MKKHGVEGILRKNLLMGDIEGKIEEVLNPVFLTLNKFNFPNIPIKAKPRIVNQYLTKKQGEISLKLRQVVAKISSKTKTCLKDI